MWNFQTPMLTEEHMPYRKARGTFVMETFYLELHHNIMLSNKCSLDCKPVVATMPFSLGGKCAYIYMSVHVHIQKTHQKSNRTIS